MGADRKTLRSRRKRDRNLAAGADVAMLCHDSSIVPAAIEAVANAIEAGRFEPKQWAAGRERIARMRERIRTTSRPLPALDVVGCPEHRALAQAAREIASLTYGSKAAR